MKGHNPEDISFWYLYGESREALFIKEVAPLLGLRAERNPAKSSDKTAPDLLVNSVEAELKTEETPFFTAKKAYGIDPQYAVSFNRGDYVSYKKRCPMIDVYFWVNWQELEYGRTNPPIVVQPMYGIYRVNFRQLADAIECGAVRVHSYHRRVYDPINEKQSYGFDVRTFECLCQFDPKVTNLTDFMKSGKAQARHP
jgi:hypothetical protein